MTILLHNKMPPPNEVIDIVKKKGFLICEDAIRSSNFESIQRYWINRFKQLNNSDLPKYDRSPKYLLGQENFSAIEDKKKEYRVKIQEFLWNDIHYDTRELLIEMQKFTNLCLKRNSYDGLLYHQNKNALSLSVNYYPPNKGRLTAHKDSKDTDLYLWMIFNLTFKGDHFNDGGLYLIDEENKKIDLDKLSTPSSVIFFNGMLEHGVDLIKSENGLGKISVFPFNTYYETSDTIPKYVKLLLNINNKIRSKLLSQKKEKKGLKN